MGCQSSAKLVRGRPFHQSTSAPLLTSVFSLHTPSNLAFVMTTGEPVEPDAQPGPTRAAAYRLPVTRSHRPLRQVRTIVASIAIIIVAIVALGVSAYLTSVALSGGSVAGCDSAGGAGCDEVLSSRWSLWFAVPVSGLAVAVYGSVLAAIGFTFIRHSPQIVRAAWSVLLVLSATAFGAAVWFTSLQLFELGSVCKFCMTVHACGLLLFVLVSVGGPIRWRRGTGPPAGREALISITRAMALVACGLLGTGVLIAGQAFYTPAMYHVDRAQPKGVSPKEDQADPAGGDRSADEPDEPQPVKSRMLKLYKSEQTIDVYQHPIIGSPAAKHILVKLFDYTCPHCRARHYQLETIRSHSHGQLGVVVLPVPLDSACNKYAGSAKGTRHAQACVYARLAIAVWLADRNEFEEFHRWLFETKRIRSAKVAREYAIKLVGQGPLDEQLDGFHVSELIGQYVDIYGKSGRGRIPKLITDRVIIDGHFHDGKELGEVLSKEIGLRINFDE